MLSFTTPSEKFLSMSGADLSRTAAGRGAAHLSSQAVRTFPAAPNPGLFELGSHPLLGGGVSRDDDKYRLLVRKV